MWILLTIIAQFFNALVTILDRHIVVGKKIDPVVYAIYSLLLSGFVFLMFPFIGFKLPSYDLLVISFLSAVLFSLALICLYKALFVPDASDVAPIVGAFTAVFSFIASFFVLNTILTLNFGIGVLIMALGMVFYSHFRFHKHGFSYSMFAGILFGLSSVYLKLIFDSGDFMTVFVWSRIMLVVSGILLLAYPGVWKKFFKSLTGSAKGSKRTIAGNKILAAVASVLVLIAIDWGDVSVVNALTGLQFAFIILLAVFLPNKKGFIKEENHNQALIHKSLPTILIIFGLFILFI